MPSDILPVFGKHAGIVRNNRDPKMAGRMQVEVPSVLGRNSVWARPCVPYAADGLGLFLMPPTGASIWVEFEAGDPSRPIWTGCYWKDGQAPASDVSEMVLATPSGKLRFGALSPRGDIRLELSDGTAVTLTAKSIVIDTGATGKVEVTATSTSVNSTALEVR